MTRMHIFAVAVFVTLAVTSTVLALRSPEIAGAIAIGELAKCAVEASSDGPVVRLPRATIVAKRLTPEEVARIRAADSPTMAAAPVASLAAAEVAPLP